MSVGGVICLVNSVNERDSVCCSAREDGTAQVSVYLCARICVVVDVDVCTCVFVNVELYVYK